MFDCVRLLSDVYHSLCLTMENKPKGWGYYIDRNSFARRVEKPLTLLNVPQSQIPSVQ